MKPGVLPSWAVPAIEGIPEAIQAASKAASHATEAAKDAVQTVVAAGTTLLPTPEKVIPERVLSVPPHRMYGSVCWLPAHKRIPLMLAEAAHAVSSLATD